MSLMTLITGQTSRRELRGLMPQQRGGSVLRTVRGCGVGQKAEDQTSNHRFTESFLNRSSLYLFLPHKCSFLSVLSLVLPLNTLPAWVSSFLSNASATVLYVGDCSMSTSCQDSFHECGRHSLGRPKGSFKSTSPQPRAPQFPTQICIRSAYDPSELTDHQPPPTKPRNLALPRDSSFPPPSPPTASSNGFIFLNVLLHLSLPLHSEGNCSDPGFYPFLIGIFAATS